MQICLLCVYLCRFLCSVFIYADFCALCWYPRCVPNIKMVNISPINERPYIPEGLNALYTACRQIYPDQPNPLQVSALVKLWLGGPDPLDYISMFTNPGIPAFDIEPHWHYVSFGLSDLHGDGRVHEMSSADTLSGFGFELTFRLKREPEEQVPPTWPAAIMQALAKYVFQSENTLCAGDHVSWHCPLDNSGSRIQHMLMCEDPQLGTVQTPYGPVTFIQIIGVCSEELQAAQEWNGPGIVDLMKSVKGAGGPWLVTNMRRGESIFELDPRVQETVDEGIEADGSNLSGVSACCSWAEKKVCNNDTEPEEMGRGFAQIKKFLKRFCSLKKVLVGSKEDLPNIRPSSSHCLYDSTASQCTLQLMESYDISGDMVPIELAQTKYLEGVHLHFNLEAGTILPLALKGRLRNGRHFTFNSVTGDIAITFVSPNVSGTFADIEHPYAARGPWLQILLNENDIEIMLVELIEASELDANVLPKTFEWCDGRLIVTLMNEEF